VSHLKNGSEHINCQLSAAGATVTHWDGQRKTTSGLIRVDGKTYTFLGDDSGGNIPSNPGPVAKKLDNHDVAGNLLA
jgi:hypothetical protein